MTSLPPSIEKVLDLSPGDLVRVRSAAEIFRTLDAEGSFDNLPFMPEMVQYCGRTLASTSAPIRRATALYCAECATRSTLSTSAVTDPRMGVSSPVLDILEGSLARAGRALSDSSDKSQLGPSEQAFIDETLLRATIKSASVDSEEPNLSLPGYRDPEHSRSHQAAG